MSGPKAREYEADDIRAYLEADSGDVVVVLSGGRPDPDVRTFFDALEAGDTQLGADVRATIAITEVFA